MLPRHRAGPRCEEDAGLICHGVAPEPAGLAAGAALMCGPIGNRLKRMPDTS
jgi:hypothetical protein